MMDKNSISKHKGKTNKDEKTKKNISYANMHIGKAFQNYRLMNNLTQNDVSNITGLEPRHISQLERGQTKGSIDTLIKLCNAYKITPDVILFDILDEDTKSKVQMYDEKFKKLSKKDKDTILHLMEYFLSK